MDKRIVLTTHALERFEVRNGSGRDSMLAAFQKAKPAGKRLIKRIRASQNRSVQCRTTNNMSKLYQTYYMVGPYKKGKPRDVFVCRDGDKDKLIVVTFFVLHPWQ